MDKISQFCIVGGLHFYPHIFRKRLWKKKNRLQITEIYRDNLFVWHLNLFKLQTISTTNADTRSVETHRQCEVYDKQLSRRYSLTSRIRSTENLSERIVQLILCPKSVILKRVCEHSREINRPCVINATKLFPNKVGLTGYFIRWPCVLCRKSGFSRDKN